MRVPSGPVYGERKNGADYFFVTVEVISKYPTQSENGIVTFVREVHFPLRFNLNAFLRDIEDEYGDGAILSIRTERHGS